MIKCPVCNNELINNDKQYVCLNNHSFDKNKKGYTNLLMSNQLNSKDPGDNQEMINSRVNFLKTDKYNKLRKELFNIISRFNKDNFTFLDIACGEGYYTNYLMKEFNSSKGYGIDLSKYALINAIKNKKELGINNIDYFIASLTKLPFINETIDVALNCFAPLDEIEFNRVLKKDGIFIRVLPSTYHLWELKEVLYETVKENIEKEKELLNFKLLDIIEVNDTIELNNEEINNLFLMTPYYYKSPITGSTKLKNMDYLKTRI